MFKKDIRINLLKFYGYLKVVQGPAFKMYDSSHFKPGVFY